MGLFGSKKKPKPVIVGHKYYVGMHMITGHGNMDGVEKIRVGEKIAWSTSDSLEESYTVITSSNSINHPDLLVGQTFITINSYTISSVTLKLYRTTGNEPGTITVSIRATNEITGLPTGDDLCSGTTDGDTIILNPASISLATERNIEFDVPILLNSNTKYAIVAHNNKSPDTFCWASHIPGAYSGGSFVNSPNRGSTWSATLAIDLWFKTFSLNGVPPNHTIQIISPNLFGGTKKEGGVSGWVDLMFGGSTQARNSYLVGKLDASISAFRGLMSFILKQIYVGTSPYIKPWGFFCKRVSKQVNGDDQWYKEKAIINPREPTGDDLNAAHIIRECLINKEWGLGFDETDDIDDTVWRKAADILYDEGFGLSILWDQTQPLEDFIGSILDCINGFLYQDLETGKWILSLTREPTVSEILQNSYDPGGDTPFGSIYGIKWVAQTFIPAVDYTITSVKLKLNRSGTIDDSFIVSIRNTSNIIPTGGDLCAGSHSTFEVTTDAAGDWYEIDFSSGVALTANQRYAIVMRVPNGIDPSSINWLVKYTGTHLDGNFYSSNDAGSSWGVTSHDGIFKTYSHGDLYNIETFDENDIIEIDEFVRPSYGEVINQVVINWWDKIADKPRPSDDQDIALIEKENGNVIETIHNYYGICNKTLANKVAARELKLASSMLASMRIRATRKMSHLKPNDIFKLSWGDLGIVQMVIRVLEVNYGNLDKNEIVLNCIEDSFLTAETIYIDAPETDWTNPVSDAIDVVNRRLIEVPYWSLCNNWENQSIIDSYGNDVGFMYIIASPPVLDAFDFDFLVQYAATYDFILEGTGTWSPTATIVNDVLMDAKDISTLDLENIINLEGVTEGTYAIIENEIIEINSVDVDNDQINISRGMLDTVPEAHSAGAMIYFAGSNYEGINIEYTNGDQPKIKILPRTGSGVLASTLLTTQITFDSRMIRPYLPGNLKFNNVSYPQFLPPSISGNQITISWNHRDRTDPVQLQSLIKHTAGNIGGLETGTTYTIEVYNGNDVEGTNSPYTGETGTSWNYTEIMEVADFNSLQDELRFVITAVRAGYDSWQSYDITISRIRGSAIGISGVDGSLSVATKLRSSIVGASTVSAVRLNSVLFAGFAAGISGVDGSLNIATKLRGSTIGASNVSTPGLNFALFDSSIVGVSGADGFLSNTIKLQGSIAGVSTVDGSLSGIDDPEKQDYYIVESGSNEAGVYDVRWEGTSFTTSKNYTITSVKLFLLSDTQANKIVTIKIFECDGSHLPSGAAKCSGSINCNTLSATKTWEEISLGVGASLENGKEYAICCEAGVDITGSTDFIWRIDLGNQYANGGRQIAGADHIWDGFVSSHDFLFETWGYE